MNSSASGYDANASGMIFATTHWSVVLTAQGQSPAAQAALETLCRTYGCPFTLLSGGKVPGGRSEGFDPGIFRALAGTSRFRRVRREKGRLRSYLLVSLKHFLANERDRARTMKRGSGAQPISLDEILAHQRFDLEPVEALTADQIYERQWATAVLDQVLAGLDQEYRGSGRGLLFDRLKVLLTDEPGHPSQAEIGQELGMTENAVKQAFHRLRLRFGRFCVSRLPTRLRLPPKSKTSCAT